VSGLILASIGVNGILIAIKMSLGTTWRWRAGIVSDEGGLRLSCEENQSMSNANVRLVLLVAVAIVLVVLVFLVAR
jgi:hypothetical protein